MSSYTNIFGGSAIQSAFNQYNAISLSANTALAWPTTFQNTLNVVATNMNVTPTNNGFTLFLPQVAIPAAGPVPAQPFVTTGTEFTVINVSGFSFTLSTFAGAQTFNIAAGASYTFLLINNTTTDGTFLQFTVIGAPSITSITEVVAASALGNMTIAPMTINANGTFTFTFANDLLALINLSTAVPSTGFAVRTGASTWALRSINGTANQINVVNPSGIAGNLTISLPPTVTGINNLTAGNINITGDTISDIAGNAITIAPGAGTQNVFIAGNLQIAAGFSAQFIATDTVHYFALGGGNMAANVSLILPTTAPLGGQVLGYTGIGTQLGWITVTTFGGPSTPNAIAKYINNTGGLTNSGILIDNTNNMTGATSITVGNLLLGGAINTNTIASTNANGNIIALPNGTGEFQSFGNINVLNGQLLKISEVGSTNYTSIMCPPIAANIPLVLPIIAPTSNQILAGSYTTNATVQQLTWVDPSPLHNMVMNGSAEIWQRGASITNASFVYVNNNNTTVMDGWKLQSNGNNVVNVTRISPGPQLASAASLFALRATVVTANLKFGFLHIMEQFDSQQLSNRFASISACVRAAGINNFKMAVVYSNTAAPTLPLVTAWNAQGVDPTLAAGWFYITPTPTTLIPTAGVFTRVQNITVAPIPTAAALVGLFIWIDDTTAGVNSTFDISCLGLYPSVVIPPFEPEDFATNLSKCKRRFATDIPYGTTFGLTNVISSPGTYFVSPINAAITITPTTVYGGILYETELRVTPGIIHTFPITNTALVDVVSTNASVDEAAATGTINTVDARGFTLRNANGAAQDIVTNGYILFHYYADAEF